MAISRADLNRVHYLSSRLDEVRAARARLTEGKHGMRSIEIAPLPVEPGTEETGSATDTVSVMLETAIEVPGLDQALAAAEAQMVEQLSALGVTEA